MIQNGGDDPGREGVIGFSCSDEVAKRIAQLYGDERLADVTFVVQQGEDGNQQRFVGHRNIISTWSRPLDRMLCGDFAEGSSREVHIHDVEPFAFEAMLKLMYCGTAEITVDNVLAILDVSVRFDVAPLVQFSVQFLQNHTSSEHACRMLEVGVQYSLVKLMDKCIELIVTDDHILVSEDFSRLSQAAVIELAKHDSWNMHEDEIYDTMVRWAVANSSNAEEQQRLLGPILEHLRYPHMSVEKLKSLTATSEVPNQLIFDALFFKLHHSDSADDTTLQGRYRPRPGSLLFSWVPTSKVTVSGNYRENSRHTSSNGFTGVRGDRRMQHGMYSWSIEVVETHSSWIFVGVAQADDPNDVAWRSSGRMLYCLDSRFFHQGSGQNHPSGDRKISSGDCIRVVLDCTNHTLAFGINNEKPLVLFRELAPVAYVPAVDLRDCGDKVCILSSNPHVRNVASWPSRGQQPAQVVQGGGGGRAPEADATVGPGATGGALPASGTSAVAAPPPSRRPTPTDIPSGVPPQVPGEPEAAMPGATMTPGSINGTSSMSAGPPVTAMSSGRTMAAPEASNLRRSSALEGFHQAHAAPHPMHGIVASTSRTLQPRQSQGPQGGAPAVSATTSAQERGSFSSGGYGSGGGGVATAVGSYAAPPGNGSVSIGGLPRPLDPEPALFEDREIGWDGHSVTERDVPPM